jgi:hypothetical protein
MEGVSNILLLRFQTTITKEEQEITNNADFSLPIPRERSNPSFTKQIHHSRSGEQASKRCTSLLIHSPKDSTIKYLHKRETP